MAHIPVLLHEVIDGLNLKEGDIVLDGTVGNGGHAKELCEHIGSKGTLIGIDLDEEAIEEAKKRLAGCPSKIVLEKENFKNLDTVLQKSGVEHINRALFDLGMRSDQLEFSGRGFSFQKDEPLIMTFERRSSESGQTAAEIINSWDEDALKEIFKKYGEERFAGRIAKAIVKARKKKHIMRTGELVAVISESIPARFKNQKIHPATRVFQALRIAVNNELESLEVGIQKALDLLLQGGRIAVISFHSLEDRIVKNIFREHKATGAFTLVTKKPVQPSREEMLQNPRARSAKLRIIEKN